MANISVDELEILFAKILEKLRSENQDVISVSQDFYRLIPTDEWDRYDSSIDVGSLYDDIHHIKNVVYDKSLCTYVDFDRTASILRAISQINNPI